MQNRRFLLIGLLFLPLLMYGQREETKVNITKENLSQTVDQLEKDGMSGLLYVKLGGEEVMIRPFGLANKTLELPITRETIFGTGSRPIDYTLAAMYYLVQEGEVELDHTLDQYFEDVPADKQSITLRYLMTGQSGLPDFFDEPQDWDPDLAWVDRKTAEDRILKLGLMFTPGEMEAHSHAAFELLAAVIERVSGLSYYDFIRLHFLDPANMTRTGEYGESRGLKITDFAEGYGPSSVGVPNIPPNWGPTSWLIKGSGGMYSTLDDLIRFYDLIRSGKVLEEPYRDEFSQPTVNLDGSDRGFELFSIYDPKGHEVYLFSNDIIDRDRFEALARGLLAMVRAEN